MYSHVLIAVHTICTVVKVTLGKIIIVAEVVRMGLVVRMMVIVILVHICRRHAMVEA